MVGVFLLSQSFAANIKNLGLGRIQRALVIGVVGLLVFGLSMQAGFPVNAVYVALFALLFAVAQDAFVHWEIPGFGWIVCWLLLLSLFLSVFYYRFNTIQDSSIRKAYAQALVADRDLESFENNLPDLYKKMESDTANLGSLLKPWPFKQDAAVLQQWAGNFLFEKNYVFQRARLARSML